MSDIRRDHYRKVFKSDHLSSYDLEDFMEQKRALIFTISHVTQHIIDPNIKGTGIRVAGKMISANIGHFIEPIKPMVINAGNSDIMKKLTGSFIVQDWKNVQVELYIDKNRRLSGNKVQGIAIKEEVLKPFTAQDIELFKAKIYKITDNKGLIDLYNSDKRIQVNNELAKMFSARKQEIASAQ